MSGIRAHQNRGTDCRTVDNRAAGELIDCRRSDVAPREFAITSRFVFMLSDEAETISKLYQVLGTGIDESEPATRTKHPRRFREILRCEDADDEVNGRVTYRPLGP